MSAQCPQPSNDLAPKNRFAAMARLPRKPRRTDASRLPLLWADKANTREGELFRRVVRQLQHHVGGTPSHAQELLIGRIAWLSVHLARMDQRILESGEMSEHTGKQYLAWSNSITRGLVALGLQPPPPPERPWREVLADIHARGR